eukprot:CCRYP_002474-RH/>CCRYP_002474-RH protein AED:0.43 eAED:0.43 QI:0/0/0/1/0/0/3/0/126
MATSLVYSMATPTPHAYDILISGFARRDLLPSLTTYQTVLLSLATTSQFDQTMSLLTHMRRRGIRPTIYTYNSLLNACAQSKPPRWKEALSFLSQCQREPGITPDLVSYTTAMRMVGMCLDLILIS